jgi:hypothetical protein
MPVQVSQPGFVYAKVLATDGNAVNDGYHANGSVEARTGWRVAFAWIHENGTREEMGEFVDGTPGALVPVSPEGAQLVITVRWPSDAQTVGGPEQTVWVALAYRQAASGEGPGATSGVQMDEARALSLALRFAPGVATDAAGKTTSPTPAPGGGSTTTPTPATPSTPGAGSTRPPTPSTPGASPTPSGSGTPTGGTETAIPPVGPIESTSPSTSIVFMPSPIPTWFLVSVALMGFVSVASLSLLAAGVWLLAKRRREAPVLRRVVRVPVRVRDADPPREAPGRRQP